MTSNTSAENPRAKPMRLGTKSCLECRRRKVRCIFATPDVSRCRQCVLHKIRCIPQGFSRPDQDDKQTEAGNQPQHPQLLTPPALDEYPRLRAVLETIPSPLSAATSHRGRNASASPPADNVQQSRLLATFLESLLADESEKLARNTQISSGSTIDHGQEETVFTSAPLLEYLRNTAIGGSPSEGEAGFASPAPPIVNKLNEDDLIWKHTVLPLIPDHSTRRAIFELTRPYWSIWPLSHLFPDSISEACTFIGQDLRDPDVASRDHPGPAAKRLVWLALCLQQLPWSFHDAHREAFTRHKPSQLVRKLLHVATDLVHLSCGTAKPSCTLAALEALIIAYKCYMNMGQPRQGWKCSRLGIDNALLLGLHRRKSRIDGDPASEQRKKAIWTALWSHDRQMALFMGVPYAVPEHFLVHQVPPTTGDLIPHLSREQEALGRMMIISGHIVDRDQIPSALFSETVRIAEEIEEAKDMIPSDVWLLKRVDLADQPVGLPFWRRATIFFYHYSNHLLHLPFAVRGMREAKYRYCRDIALASAEGMLLAFQNTPTANNGLPVVCDWLDFAAFSGAMALVLDLLDESSVSGADTKPAASPRRTSQEKERLWTLIMQFATDMRHKCRLLDCRVSRQAADVLEHLHAVQKGTFVGPGKYEVVIPYFGRVCIKRPQLSDHDGLCNATEETTLPVQCYTADSQSQPPQVINAGNITNAPSAQSFYNPGSTFVEFDLTAFGSARQPWSGNMDFELGEDWAAASNTLDPNEVNWNQVFEFGQDSVNMDCDLGH